MSEVTPALDAGTLRAALEHAPAFVAIVDLDFRILYLNRVAHGYRMEDTIGTDYLAFLPPEQARKVRPSFERVKQTGEPQQHESFLDPPSGVRQWYFTQISALRDDAGEITALICIITEITQRRNSEIRVDELRRELIEASHRAGMAEVATGVLHNVGNVLNSVNVSAATLMRQIDSSRLELLIRGMKMLEDNRERLPELFGGDPAGAKLLQLFSRVTEELQHEQAQLRDEVARLSQHLDLMRSIVDAQQGLAKIGEGIEMVEPDALVQQTLSMFRIDLERHMIEVVTEIEEALEVPLDKQATLQILANLIRNAIEALADREEGRQITVRLRSDDARVHLEVQDNGQGIAAEHLQRLFEHGFTTKPSGHGFGLHSSSIAARTMEGSLEAESDGPGHGALFRLSLRKGPA